VGTGIFVVRSTPFRLDMHLMMSEAATFGKWPWVWTRRRSGVTLYSPVEVDVRWLPGEFVHLLAVVE
jgi:hypothetical protein